MLPEEPGLVLRKASPLHELGPDDAAARSRNPGAGRADAAQCRSRDRRLAVHEAVHRFAEACRPPAAALLAVAEDGDAGPLLDVENAQHCVVLDLPQVIERDPPVKVGLPGLVDLGRPEEAADLVCAISHLTHSSALAWFTGPARAHTDPTATLNLPAAPCRRSDLYPSTAGSRG